MGLDEAEREKARRSVSFFASNLPWSPHCFKSPADTCSYLSEPLRKIALFQKLSTFSQPPQGGGTFFTDAIETDDELLETGLAEVVEVHPTPETRPEDQPTLGQIGQLPARSEPRRKPLRSEDQPATIARKCSAFPLFVSKCPCRGRTWAQDFLQIYLM
jgi:hypothetical protein